MNNFPRTTTEAAPERGGGTTDAGESDTRDHVKDCRSTTPRGDGNRADGPAASSSSIAPLFWTLYWESLGIGHELLLALRRCCV